jgi:hypothetical protein
VITLLIAGATGATMAGRGTGAIGGATLCTMHAPLDSSRQVQFGCVIKTTELTAGFTSATAGFNFRFDSGRYTGFGIRFARILCINSFRRSGSTLAQRSRENWLRSSGLIRSHKTRTAARRDALTSSGVLRTRGIIRHLPAA